jgi:hypothetical protein
MHWIIIHSGTCSKLINFPESRRTVTKLHPNPPLPQYVFMAWYLVKHRDNFTFTFAEVKN